jgi:hypothetical protein
MKQILLKKKSVNNNISSVIYKPAQITPDDTIRDIYTYDNSKQNLTTLSEFNFGLIYRYNSSIAGGFNLTYNINTGLL